MPRYWIIIYSEKIAITIVYDITSDNKRSIIQKSMKISYTFRIRLMGDVDIYTKTNIRLRPFLLVFK